MKTVWHLLPGFCPMDCEYAQSSQFPEGFSFLSVTHNGREWERLLAKSASIFVCLVTQQVNNFVSHLWLGGLWRFWENQAELHLWPELVFLQSSGVKSGQLGEECRCWVRKNTTRCRVGTVNSHYQVDLLTFDLVLFSMKLTGKCFCFYSSFTYSSWTSAFATPFNDTAATKSHLIPFHQGAKLLKM